MYTRDDELEIGGTAFVELATEQQVGLVRGIFGPPTCRESSGEYQDCYFFAGPGGDPVTLYTRSGMYRVGARRHQIGLDFQSWLDGHLTNEFTVKSPEGSVWSGSGEDLAAGTPEFADLVRLMGSGNYVTTLTGFSIYRSEA